MAGSVKAGHFIFMDFQSGISCHIFVGPGCRCKSCEAALFKG
jgi:hypothetical protein